MANIVINEISQNYTYNIGNNSFATVALPITSCWGPGYFDYASLGYEDREEYLEKVMWQHYPATQAGLESFVAAYRGPASNYKLMKDYSYQLAMTLLTAGYDVLTCRVCPGIMAGRYLPVPDDTTQCIFVNAKYPGTFGNNLLLRINKVTNAAVPYYNLIVYIVDASGVRTAAENLIFRLTDVEVEDNIPVIGEVESNFITLTLASLQGDPVTGQDDQSEVGPISGQLDNSETGPVTAITDASTPGEGDLDPRPNTPDSGDSSSEYVLRILVGGSDKFAPMSGSASAILESAKTFATERYLMSPNTTEYPTFLTTDNGSARVLTAEEAERVRNREWIFTQCMYVYDLLQDKLAYNPQRIISPGWDDQDYDQFGNSDNWPNSADVSPFHIKLMTVAYNSRCATSLIDIPRSMPRKKVYNDSMSTPGYAQKLGRYIPTEGAGFESNGSLYQTHSALFAPWGQYMYVGMAKQSLASPSFLALMIQRAMLLNQALQYEWALPTSRRQNLKIGKMAYNVPKKYLDQWQTLEGVGVNVITAIPDLGTSLWGNSTLYEVPPATYQALANLSTRYLVNAIENVVYKCGIAITFRYNNAEAYSSFYAGVTPLLDTMKNVGAIDDYYVRMAADINGLDQVNANTVVGKIYLVVNGVINDIIVDLIALPPGSDLDQYRA